MQGAHDGRQTAASANTARGIAVARSQCGCGCYLAAHVDTLHTTDAKSTCAEAALSAACLAWPLFAISFHSLARLFSIAKLCCAAGPEAEPGIHQGDDGGHAARARLPASRQACGRGFWRVAVGAHVGSAREAGKVARVLGG